MLGPTKKKKRDFPLFSINSEFVIQIGLELSHTPKHIPYKNDASFYLEARSRISVNYCETLIPSTYLL